MDTRIEIERQSRDALVRELETAGATVKGSAVKCPFHEDRHASGSIYSDDAGVWRYKCQAASCGAGGDVFDIRAKATNRPLEDVLKEASDMNVTRKPMRGNLSAQSGPRVYPTEESLKAALPGRIVSQHVYHSSTGESMMTVFRCETPEGKSYRPVYPVPGGYVMAAPSKPWPLYHLPEISNADTVVVVEGEKCSDALVHYGIPSTTSPFGAGKAEHADWLPLAGKNCILWPDNDATGRNHMKQVREILERLQPVARVSLIEPATLDLGDKEDVADFIDQLRNVGKNDSEIKAELHRVLATARPLDFLTGLRDHFGQIARGEFRSISLPWSGLTSLAMPIMPGSVTMLAGTPGASKSLMLLQAVLYWLEAGENVSVLAFEGDLISHQKRALGQLSGIADVTRPDWIKDNTEEADLLINTHAKTLERLARHWTVGQSINTLDQALAWIETEAKAGRKIICVDPVTSLMRTGKPWEEDHRFVTTLKRIAESYGISVLCVTHPVKGTSEPTRENLAGGAAYERHVDVILALQSHDSKSSTVSTGCGSVEIEHNRTLRIEKARNGPGTNYRLAFSFNKTDLTLQEHGVIVKKQSQKGVG